MDCTWVQANRPSCFSKTLRFWELQGFQDRRWWPHFRGLWVWSTRFTSQTSPVGGLQIGLDGTLHRRAGDLFPSRGWLLPAQGLFSSRKIQGSWLSWYLLGLSILSLANNYQPQRWLLIRWWSWWLFATDHQELVLSISANDHFWAVSRLRTCMLQVLETPSCWVSSLDEVDKIYVGVHSYRIVIVRSETRSLWVFIRETTTPTLR